MKQSNSGEERMFMIPRHRALGCTVLTLAAASAAMPLTAQEIRGRLTDAANGAPVGLAGVFLLDQERDLVEGTATDTAGFYRMDLPAAGDYYVFVQRLGYFENESPLVSIAGDRDLSLDFEMRPEPFRLDLLEVSVRNEEMERFLTLELGANPNSIFGYRAIQGARLQEARVKAVDNTDLLRWLYIPVSHGIEVCVGTMGRGMPDRNRRLEVGERQCGELLLDGYRVPNEHIESIDFDRVAVVVTLPGQVRLYTREFGWNMKPGGGRDD